MELSIDELTALTLQHGRLALAARKLADEHDKLAQLYLEAGKRFNREVEAKESKMNIRKIISGVGVLLLLAAVFSMGSLITVAQDVPTGVPVTATLNGQPVEATLEPIPAPITPADNGSAGIISLLLDKLGDLALIAALVLLAFKVANLVPPDVIDKALARGFDLAKGLADGTPTPVDNRLLEIAQPIITKLIQDELAKRDSAAASAATGLRFTPPSENP